ncbi:MAG: glycoside hydrolase family 2 TIM barrel-domain containing protein, partial [Opitutus sp.]
GTLTVQTWVRGADAARTRVEVSQAVYAWPDGTKPVLELPIQHLNATGSDDLALTETAAPWAEALRWSPEHPHLYTLRTTVRAGDRSETVDTRFGFREFWIDGKNFMLNGQPIRLRGPSQEKIARSFPPETARVEGRRLLEWYQREFHYNAVRMHGFIHEHDALLAADEAGLLVVNQSSLWSSVAPYYDRGVDELLRHTEAQFAEWYWRDVNSPSSVIWDVENELLRFGRTPERERWVLKLDALIKNLDPAAVVQHSGAAWINPQQEVIHIHMQEQYNRAMREWSVSGKVPLVLGEFWMGGRGETRLPSGYDFDSREDWHTEESRIYREKFLEARYYGASGIMPFLMQQWLIVPNPKFSARHPDPGVDAVTWKFPTLRNEAARGLSPVVGFVWPRRKSILADSAFNREIVVCNDREEPVTLTVDCTYGSQQQRWQVTLAPAGQQRRSLTLNAETSGDLVVTVRDSQSTVLESDRLPMHVIAKSVVATPSLHRRLVVVPVLAPSLTAALRELGLTVEVSSTLPIDAAHTLVLVPPGVARDALGRRPDDVRRYLQQGGRLLVLAQTEAPAWLPLGLPFWSSVRSSLPEFDRAGWPAITKDLLYSRDLPLHSPGHPIFAGLVEGDFEEWNAVDGRVADDTFVRPHAIGMHAGGPYRVLAGATRRENAAVLEFRIGNGTALLCQAQVIENRQQPAARAVLMNLLRYLDGPAWTAPLTHIGLTGNLTAAQLSALTALPADSFAAVHSAQDQVPSLILSGDKSDPALLDQLARSGHTVLVLSAETAGRLPGYTVAPGPRSEFFGTRHGASDDPLWWGVASANFLPLGKSLAHGELTRVPADALTVLGGLRHGPPPGAGVGFFGLETLDHAAPVAVMEKRGSGRLVVTTLEPWDPAAESHRQLLATLLANAGVDLPNLSGQPAVIAVKTTVPLQFDGQLDDWTSDMEDRSITQFIHATPIVLTSADTTEPVPGGDLAQSAILYLLQNKEHLYVGGILFPAEEPAHVELTLGERRIALDLATRQLTVDGRAIAKPALATGTALAHAVIDTRLLSLVEINWLNGRADPKPDSPGRTFEVALPWSELGGRPAATEIPVRFRVIHSPGKTLQVPLTDADPALIARFK